MKTIAASDIRNVALISHGGHGTTSLGETLLFNAQETSRLGRVDGGTSNFDIEPEEIERKSSVSLGIASCRHKGKRITIIDTPGSVDFVSDTENALRVCDSVVMVVSAVDGVEVRTESLWGKVQSLNRPAAFFINKLDRERADFYRTVEDIKSNLSPAVIPLSIPIGEEGAFRGIVDLLSNHAHLYQTDGSGKFETSAIPSELAEQVEQMRKSLVEEIAGSDESLMEKYFEEGDLSSDDLRKGLTRGVKEGVIYPVFAGCATLNIGVQPLMDLIAQVFPGADEAASAESEDGSQSRPSSADAPFSSFVFKTIADQFAGQLSVFRIMSGSINSDGSFFNSSKQERERYGTILSLQGKEQKPLEAASVGDIVAVAKLKATATGDTLCEEAHPIVFAKTEPPLPTTTFAVRAKKKGEDDKVFSGLKRLMEEDPSLQIERDPSSGETLLKGMGQVHIEVTLQKLMRKFKVEADLELPKIPYRETIKARIEKTTYRHKKQTGGKGQFGECTIEISPLERSKGFEFEDAIVGGAIPRQFIPAVEKGIVERMNRGVIAGYPVVDVKVRLYDGKYHPVDSSEMAFKIAGSMGFKKAFEQAKPIMLEPIHELLVTVPKENVGDVMGNISGRRGRVLGMEDHGKYTTIKAQVPLNEAQRYSSDLRSMTSGRGTFQMSFSHHEELPGELASKVIAAYHEEEEEE
ncbi:MAG: elongation factor G [Bradymonadales bacterium]|nr:elongation factor G [Bradymonadales bacterium]